MKLGTIVVDIEETPQGRCSLAITASSYDRRFTQEAMRGLTQMIEDTLEGTVVGTECTCALCTDRRAHPVAQA